MFNFTNNQRNPNWYTGVPFLPYFKKFNSNTQNWGKCERMVAVSFMLRPHELTDATILKDILAICVNTCQYVSICAKSFKDIHIVFDTAVKIWKVINIGMHKGLTMKLFIY